MPKRQNNYLNDRRSDGDSKISDADQSTIAGALTVYLGSADHCALALSTKAEYARIVGHLVDEIGQTIWSQVDRTWLRGLRNEWAKSGYRAATLRLQVLRNALKPAIDEGLIPAGLFEGLNRVDRPHNMGERNPIWSDDEVEVAIRVCIDNERFGLARAIALARYAGFRRSEICVLPRAARVQRTRLDGSIERRIRFRTRKRGVLADRPEDPRLTRVLEETDFYEVETLAYNYYGMPWLPRQLTQALDRMIARLTKHGMVRENLTLHGLRHSRGVELAEVGASDATIMAHLDHTDEQAARIYRRQAARAVLADRGQELINAKLATLQDRPK